MLLKNHNINKYIMNVKLAAYTGLYQMINPESPTIFGYNAYHVGVTMYVGFIVILLIFIPVGLYHWTNDTSQFVIGVILLGNYFFSCYKIITIMKNSKKIWECIDVTRVDFMGSYKNYDTKLLNKCLVRSLMITYVYSVLCYILLILWYLAPLALVNAHLAIKQRDGTYWNYRVNVHNLYIPVSAESYNKYFTYLYFLEIAFGLCYILFSVIFDNFIVSMCLAISCQIETISNAFISLGHKPVSTLLTYDNIHNRNYSNKVFTQELRMLVKDYQDVLKKLQDFYIVVRPVILTQLAVDSSTLVFLTFIIALNYSSNTNENVNSIQSLKMISAVPVCVFQLFSACYLFGNIHSKIDSINSAVYSCNWTEMDVGNKQLVLLKMNMNNASQMQLKVTVTKVINLEMFLSVMHMCYSVLSVMVNSNLNSTD